MRRLIDFHVSSMDQFLVFSEIEKIRFECVLQLSPYLTFLGKHQLHSSLKIIFKNQITCKNNEFEASFPTLVCEGSHERTLVL